MDRKVYAFAAILVLVGFFCVHPAEATVFSVENKVENLYGKGVHAFFDGAWQESVSILSEVEKLGSDDPRPYFFLGLAHRRLGKADLADKYLKMAAQKEWDGQSGRDFNVSDALRRIQGRERLAVEAYRKQAKLDWQKEEGRRRQIKYGDEKTKDREILVRLAKPVIATAPFGARSVNPFDVSTSVRPESVREADTPATAQAPASEGTLKSKDEEKPAAAKDDDPVEAEKKDDEKAGDMEADEDDDPFADSADEKKADEKEKSDAKKEDAKEEDEDDDPFQ